MPVAISESRNVEGLDDLRRLTRGVDFRMVQIQPGALRGRITDIDAGAVGLRITRFSHGMRRRGVMSLHDVFFGLALVSHGAHTHWSHDISNNDLVVCPPGFDVDSTFRGGMALAIVSAPADMLAGHFSHEGPLSDPAWWRQRRIIRATDAVAARLRNVLSALEHDPSRQPAASTIDDAVRQREVLEAFSCWFMQENRLGPDTAVMRSAVIVKMVEDFIAATGARPAHISELSAAVGVSRRTLSRAFSETMGIGPMDFLRKARLGAVHSALKRSDPATTKIGDIAAEHGFTELGRFSAYYGRLFGERPSDTLRKGSCGTLVRGSRMARLA